MGQPYPIADARTLQRTYWDNHQIGGSERISRPVRQANSTGLQDTFAQPETEYVQTDMQEQAFAGEEQMMFPAKVQFLTRYKVSCALNDYCRSPSAFINWIDRANASTVLALSPSEWTALILPPGQPMMSTPFKIIAMRSFWTASGAFDFSSA